MTQEARGAVVRLLGPLVAPWDLYWCLAGYPWAVVPIARLHGDGGPVQLDNSQDVLCDIPVTGSEDALRLMVVFKHPNDSTYHVPGMVAPVNATDPAYVNDIQSYDGPDAIKFEPDVKPEPEVKAKRAKKNQASMETLARNAQIEKWMIAHLLHRERFKSIRDASKKIGASIAVTLTWLEEVDYLLTRYKHQLGGDNGPEAWLVHRLRKRLEFIQTCKTETDVAEYLKDNGKPKGVSKILAEVKAMAWVKNPVILPKIAQFTPTARQDSRICAGPAHTLTPPDSHLRCTELGGRYHYCRLPQHASDERWRAAALATQAIRCNTALDVQETQVTMLVVHATRTLHRHGPDPKHGTDTHALDTPELWLIPAARLLQGYRSDFSGAILLQEIIFLHGGIPLHAERSSGHSRQSGMRRSCTWQVALLFLFPPPPPSSLLLPPPPHSLTAGTCRFVVGRKPPPPDSPNRHLIPLPSST
ncbi:hypothetical protein C8R43DRAFT_1117008 [Mycena crocata]|nr:hypothetical protein C8R43DRAFT_1117008 [Mycena crocata]